MDQQRSELESSARGSHAAATGRAASIRSAKSVAPGASSRGCTAPARRTHGTNSATAMSQPNETTKGHRSRGGSTFAGSLATATMVSDTASTRATASHRHADSSLVRVGEDPDRRKRTGQCPGQAGCRQDDQGAATRGHHLVEEALDAAVGGDLEPVERLLDAVTAPFVERSESRALCRACPAGLRHLPHVLWDVSPARRHACVGRRTFDERVDVVDPPRLESFAGVSPGALGPVVRVASVRENRGAGAGWSCPSFVTKTSRARMCGCSAASVRGRMAVTQASVSRRRPSTPPGSWTGRSR